MAAAEEQADAAVWSVYLGCAGIIGVVGTLVYTARAANAAQKAAVVAEKALTDLERPHLFVIVKPEPVGVKIINDIFYPFVEFSVSNFGRTPAEIVNLYAGTCVSFDLLGRPRAFEIGNRIVGQSHPLTGIQMYLGDKVPVTYEIDDFGNPDHTKPIPEVQPPLNVYIRFDIEYKGLGPTIYVSEFAWKWDSDSIIWTPIHNRRT